MKNFNDSSYLNLFSAMLGSLGYELMNAGTINPEVLPAALAVFGGFLGLEKLKQWKEAANDQERLEIIRRLTDRTQRIEKSMVDLDIGQFKQDQEIQQLWTSLLSAWDVVNHNKRNVDELKEAFKEKIQADNTILEAFRNYVDERLDTIAAQLEKIDKPAVHHIQQYIQINTNGSLGIQGVGSIGKIEHHYHGDNPQ